MTTEQIDGATYLRNIQAGIAPTHMYYRQPNGWITSGAATPIERLRFMDEGWVPLTAYGRFDMAHVWCAQNPHVTLFQFGGAKELPLDQIIENGYHLNPPLVPACGQALTSRHKHDSDCYLNARPVHFPQLDGVELPAPAQCRFCERPPFPSAKARDQHEGVMHKDEKTAIRTGEVMGANVTKGNENLIRGLMSGLAPAAPPTGQAGSAVSITGLPYVCGFCGEGFKNPIGLGKHVKVVHKEAPVGAS